MCSAAHVVVKECVVSDAVVWSWPHSAMYEVRAHMRWIAHAEVVVFAPSSVQMLRTLSILADSARQWRLYKHVQGANDGPIPLEKACLAGRIWVAMM